MAYRFLKHIPSGLVYMYATPWIGHPDFEEVADAQGNPLLAADVEEVAEAAAVPELASELDAADSIPDAATKIRKKKAGLVEVTPVEAIVPTAEEALSADATRGL